MTTPKNEAKGKATKTTASQRGKAEGVATVTSKAPDEPTQEAPRDDSQDLAAAHQAGYTASQRGTPSKPPLGYTEAEVKAWYAGYKTHANPNAEGSVDDIESGYRKNY